MAPTIVGGYPGMKYPGWNRAGRRQTRGKVKRQKKYSKKMQKPLTACGEFRILRGSLGRKKSKIISP
jgi:hypothetical protein